MQELIKKIQDTAGISEEQATAAFDTVKGFIQEKIPAGLGINIDDVLSGNFDISSLMSSFFGGGSNSDEKASDNPLDKLKNMFS